MSRCFQIMLIFYIYYLQNWSKSEIMHFYENFERFGRKRHFGKRLLLMSYGYSKSISGTGADYRASISSESTVHECQRCHSMAVRKREDGSFVCSVCNAIADIHEGYIDDDILEMSQGTQRSIRFSQVSEIDETRTSIVVLTEGIQMILACQTVAVEKILGVKIDAGVLKCITQFGKLIRAPITQSTFTSELMFILCAILEVGFPATPIDIIRWIRDGKLPYLNPTEYLPESFTQRLTTAEIKLLRPPLINLNFFFSDMDQSHRARIFPHPEAKLVVWRAASVLGVPEFPFTQFCIHIATEKAFDDITELKLSFSENVTGPERTRLTTMLRIYFGAPLALVCFALCLIYRLDGTDWIHSQFASLGFPPVTEILQRAVKADAVTPAFPSVDGDFPTLHQDLIRHLENSPPLEIEIHPIISAGGKAFGDLAEVPYNIGALSELGSDLRAIISGLARVFGISSGAIVKVFAKICSRRYGKRRGDNS